MTTTKDKIAREEHASERITEHMAKKEIESDFTGEVGRAKVIDVHTELEDSGVLAEFEVQLPDESIGYLRFTSLSSELLNKFLEEELHTTYAEMNVIMKDFMVFKTKHNWEAKIGDAPLRYVFEKDKNSNIFDVNNSGLPTLKSGIKYSIAILLLIPALYLGLPFLATLITGYFVIGLFVFIPIQVMLSPRNKKIKKNSVKD